MNLHFLPDFFSDSLCFSWVTSSRETLTKTWCSVSNYHSLPKNKIEQLRLFLIFSLAFYQDTSKIHKHRMVNKLQKKTQPDSCAISHYSIHVLFFGTFLNLKSDHQLSQPGINLHKYLITYSCFRFCKTGGKISALISSSSSHNIFQEPILTDV